MAHVCSGCSHEATWGIPAELRKGNAVYGLGFRVEGFGLWFGVEAGLGFRGEGLGLRV